MPNQHVVERLAGIQSLLLSVHKAGAAMSASSKGTEREHFVKVFLAEVLPPPFRFGMGEITDTAGRESGQIDVVVEYPFLPSLPTTAGSPRLYLAEGVAAAIEVKSDVAAQWREVEATANALRALERRFGNTSSMGEPPGVKVPLFAVGYRGWSEAETLKKHVEGGMVDGILVIETGLFVSTPEFMGIRATGPWSLWGLITCLHQATSTLKSTSATPVEYAQ